MKQTAGSQIPNYFREWRKFVGLTTTGVAERMGTTQSYVSELERGKRRWNEDTLAGYAAAIGCQPHELISVIPSKKGLTEEPENCAEATVGTHQWGQTFIRDWRTFRQITLVDLGHDTGLSHSQLSRIERGESQYTQQTLEAIAHALKVEPHLLLSEHPLEKKDALKTTWENIPPYLRGQALRTLRSFAPDKD
ncbi:MAG: hypothetical protein DHS20C06_08390 [Hyphobacterium sp.]|nr:MAG: hypothetical protein DHS20C06_08390 [Hyphobacterium sp.]